jgi:hypothetical protein
MPSDEKNGIDKLLTKNYLWSCLLPALTQLA